MPNININFQNVPKNYTKKSKIVTELIFTTHSVKFGSNFTRDRKHFTQTLFARLIISLLVQKLYLCNGFPPPQKNQYLPLCSLNATECCLVCYSRKKIVNLMWSLLRIYSQKNGLEA